MSTSIHEELREWMSLGWTPNESITKQLYWPTNTYSEKELLEAMRDMCYDVEQ